MQQRNNTITIMKAIAIICMVAGHAYTKSPVEGFVGMFHMPVFFFASGYCFKEKYLSNAFLYIKKKILALWWPTAKWLMVIVALHNLLLYLGIYELHKVYDKTPIEYYGLLDTFKYLIMAFFTLHSHAPSFAGIWFIKMLLIAYVSGYYIIRYCGWRGILWMELFLLTATVFFLSFPVRIPVIGQAHLPFLSTFFYLLGYVSRSMKWIDWLKSQHVISFTLSLVLLIIGFLFWTSSMVNVNSESCIPFCISAFSGIIIVMFLADILNKRLPPPHTFHLYIGNNTYPILMMHILSFKIVSLGLVFIFDLSYSELGDFPTIHYMTEKGWWIAYLIVGVTLPLVVDHFYYIIKKYIYER